MANGHGRPGREDLRPFGLLTVHVWIYCLTHRAELPSLLAMPALYLAQSALLVVAVLITAHRLLSPRFERLADLFACASMIAPAALIAFSPLANGPLILASALGGIGVSWAYLRWCEVFARMGIREAAAVVFLCMAGGSIGKTLVDLLPTLPAALALSAMPVISFATLRSYLADPGAHEAAPDTGIEKPPIIYTHRTIHSLRRIVAAVGIYSFAMGVIQSAFLDRLPSNALALVVIHHGSEVALGLAMALWVGRFARSISFSRTWRIVLTLMLTALIFAPYLSDRVDGSIFSLIRTAQTFLIIFLFLALTDIARHSEYRPATVFAAGWFAYSFPFVLGKLAGGMHGQLPHPELLLPLMIWVLIIASVYLLDESSAGNQFVFTELIDDADEDTPGRRMASLQAALDEERSTADPIARSCDAAVERFGLTPRERDVLELLARGRSKTYIAEAFFISENTVRGHVKRLYLKLDVHSKQQLIDLLETLS